MWRFQAQLTLDGGRRNTKLVLNSQLSLLDVQSELSDEFDRAARFHLEACDTRDDFETVSRDWMSRTLQVTITDGEVFFRQRFPKVNWDRLGIINPGYRSLIEQALVRDPLREKLNCEYFISYSDAGARPGGYLCDGARWSLRLEPASWYPRSLLPQLRARQAHRLWLL